MSITMTFSRICKNIEMMIESELNKLNKSP